MTELFGHRISEAPTALTGTAVVARLVEGLAFRYHWATEGLRPEGFDFRTGPPNPAPPANVFAGVPVTS